MADLPNLTSKEAALYDALRFGAYRGLRLEQERIPMRVLAEWYL
ncbi:Wadjet anti-phage system protein JetD domain-containing protein [Hydrogenimonas sp.]